MLSMRGVGCVYVGGYIFCLVVDMCCVWRGLGIGRLCMLKCFIKIDFGCVWVFYMVCL